MLTSSLSGHLDDHFVALRKTLLLVIQALHPLHRRLRLHGAKVDFICDELLAGNVCVNYNLVTNLQVLESCLHAALFKLGFVRHLDRYRFLARSFHRDRSIEY